jgi:hypothetical protein
MAENLGAVGMLTVLVTIRVLDVHYIVFPDLSDDACLEVSLTQTVDLGKHLVHSILKFTTETAVVSYNPLHVFLVEGSYFSVRIENLAVLVGKMLDHSASGQEHSVDFSVRLPIDQR